MAEHKVILVFGSSSAYGAGDPEGGWVSRLRRHADKSAPQNEVASTLIYNLGVSGETSEELRSRFLSETKPRIGKGKNIIFIFAIGGNDAAFVPSQQEFRVNPDQFAENLEYLVATASQFLPKIIFVELTPVNETITLNRPGKDRSKSNRFVKIFNQKLREVCNQHHLSLVPTFTAFMEEGHLNLLCEDGIHPNATGHQLIAELLEKEPSLFSSQEIG